MGAGGARPGAGRKKGGKNNTELRSLKIVDQAKTFYANKFGDDDFNDMTPLEILLFGMKLAMKEKDITTAMARASLAAPYVHPKLAAQTIDAKVSNNVAELPDALIDKLLAEHDGADAEEHGTTH